ncbi:S-adenosylmethionine:tRNA ribosyltransferase-isomerase, partial [Desulfovibrio sp. OttesenSCG-928-C14]|nr:S-adenosylmethionine:tRNA ribosyltransferase-isomerase [Desulfovibrio sp. OttesenSCG-928-C14]
KMRPGLYYPLGDGLGFTVESLEEFGQCRVSLFWQGDLGQKFWERGSLPLPPYIKRPDRSASPQDAERYQTVYADAAQAGSVAAPTAGLHFTPQLRQALLDHGHDWADISLFVGYGTFSPVRVRDIRQHAMHPEYVEVSQSSVEKILQAKARGRPVIAVGTTSTRTLEGLAEMLQDQGKLLAPYRGWLNCFIYPGRPIRVIDGLLTNFHLPESTLLMLVSALTGRKRLLAAYERAVQSGLRFFSYGDAMLIR